MGWIVARVWANSPSVFLSPDCCVCDRVLRAGHDNSGSRNQAQTAVTGLTGNFVNKSESYAQHHCKQSQGLCLGPAECPCSGLGCLDRGPWDPLAYHTPHHQV